MRLIFEARGEIEIKGKDSVEACTLRVYATVGRGAERNPVPLVLDRRRQRA